MATSDKKDAAPEAAKEPVPVDGLKVESGKVVAVPPTAEVEPPPAQPTPDEPAKPAPTDEQVVANIGYVRVMTAAEKRIENETAGTEMNLLRDAKEAHADAARIPILAGLGTENRLDDLNGSSADEAVKQVRVRLLFDWNDGQGVPHMLGKILDLPRNEAAKLIAEGRGERADPPKLPLVEQAVAEATIKAMDLASKEAK